MTDLKKDQEIEQEETTIQQEATEPATDVDDFPEVPDTDNDTEEKQ